MKLKRFAQSTIFITTKNNKKLLIDPGIYNLDSNRLTVEEFPTADIIIITHKHADHFDLGLLRDLLKRSSPLIFTNTEIKKILDKESINSKSLGEGMIINEAGYLITAVRTDHVVRDENIINFGLVIIADNTSIYYTSDTRFIDPSLLPKETKAKYLLIPISNRGVVMGIDDAIVFANEIKPELVIPLHYDSPKDKNRVDPNEFVKKADTFGIKSLIMKFGEELEL